MLALELAGLSARECWRHSKGNPRKQRERPSNEAFLTGMLPNGTPLGCRWAKLQTSMHARRRGICRRSQVLREERQQVSLDAFAESAGMIALEFLIVMRNTKTRQCIMQMLIW